jgi:hypothetical protein
MLRRKNRSRGKEGRSQSERPKFLGDILRWESNMAANPNPSPQTHADSNVSTMPERESNSLHNNQPAAISPADELAQRAADFIALTQRHIAWIERQAEEERQKWQSLIEREKKFLATMAERERKWEELRVRREALAKKQVIFPPKTRRRSVKSF